MAYRDKSGKRFCFNPFSKPHHSNWRRSSTLTKITADLRDKLEVIGVEPVPTECAKICSSCRIHINNLYINASKPRVDAIPEEVELQSVPSATSVVELNDTRLNKILELLGVGQLTVRQFRSKTTRHEIFVRATDSLKHLLKIESDVYFDDTEVPVIKDQIECYKTTSKPNQFRILTLFVSSWSRQKLVEEFGCSKWSVAAAKAVRHSKGILALPEPSSSVSVDEMNAHQNSIDFYYENCTIMPGVRDKVTVSSPSGREVRQKRLLHGTLNELYTLFRDTYPDAKIGFSTFAKLRPEECILVGSTGTHTVCVCMKHENIDLCLRAIRSVPLVKEASVSGLVEGHFVCPEPQPDCFFMRCENCPNLSDFVDKLKEEIVQFPCELVKFKNWVRVGSYFQLIDCYKTPDEFSSYFSNLLNNFLPHYFTTIKQKDHLNSLKTTIGADEAIVHADFAENYKITIQNEIQSHHFAQKMVTIHPIVVYFRENDELKHRTLVIVSSVLEHNYVLVHCCLQQLFQFTSTNLPQIKKVYMWTDGAGSQYKNKYNFANITFVKADFGIDIEWHFHASSHGKCACDGVGGAIKRAAYKYSLSPVRDELITDAQSFFKWAQKYQSRVMDFAFVSDLDFEETTEKLKPRMENVNTIKRTRALHCFVPKSEYCIEVKEYSLSDDMKTENIVY